MEKNKEVVVQNQGVSFSEEEVLTIKNTVAKDATDSELKLFLMQCKRTGLDPFSRQIYFLKMGGKASIQSSIDGFRLIAERSGKYQGQTIPLFLDKEGKWHEVWVATGFPVAAKVGVLRSDFKEPLYGIAKWDSYAPIYNGQVGTMWKKMPEVMLSKVAEALALRKAFPNDLSGIYSSEEMVQATPTVEYDVTPVEDDAVPVVAVDEETPRTSVNPVAEYMDKKGISKTALQKKRQIMELVDGITLFPLDKTAEAYHDWVLTQTELALDPQNYDAIIETLTHIKNGEHEN